LVSYKMKYDAVYFSPASSPSAARSIVVAAQNRMARWAAWLDHRSFLVVLVAYVRFALIGTEIHAPRKTVATRHEPCAQL
jgi:hypothetical protein